MACIDETKSKWNIKQFRTLPYLYKLTFVVQCSWPSSSKYGAVLKINGWCMEPSSWWCKVVSWTVGISGWGLYLSVNNTMWSRYQMLMTYLWSYIDRGNHYRYVHCYLIVSFIRAILLKKKTDSYIRKLKFALLVLFHEKKSQDYSCGQWNTGIR